MATGSTGFGMFIKLLVVVMVTVAAMVLVVHLEIVAVLDPLLSYPLNSIPFLSSNSISFILYICLFFLLCNYILLHLIPLLTVKSGMDGVDMSKNAFTGFSSSATKEAFLNKPIPGF